MSDNKLDQDMEIEALEAILMDDFKGGFIIPEIHPSESEINTSNRCFQITVSPQDDETEESDIPPVKLALIFSHTENYPDEPPLLSLKSLKGIPPVDLRILKEKLEQEAADNLGMSMVYTLVTSAKEWLSERFAQDDDDAEEEQAAKKDEIIVPHGEPVTVDTFMAWRERYEAELALERAKLMPDSAITVAKEKKLTGRQWFESGRASTKSVPIAEGSDEEDVDDIDLDDDEDFEDDEDDMLEHYLAEKTDTSIHS
ncbi:hypothetical protein CASFOL_024955 [Castilleja foliolosa]|uniref:RWD domain-containing protein n=1 Tax=Castilleja foliolosa TaxID=1961234 RepID=A0ABD3CPT1_9LAMI